MEEGMNIVASHIDSPRLDIKPNPLYENTGVAYLDTHYYGGIKKYQWVTLPLAIHGVVVKKDGITEEICIGEDKDDPVVFISDLLPHLSQEQQEKIAAYFEVSLFYLRGESNDRTRMEQWMTGDVPEDEPVYRAPVKKTLKASPAPSGGGQGGLFDAFLDSPKFRETLKETVLETLRSDEGQEILARVVAKELNRQK